MEKTQKLRVLASVVMISFLQGLQFCPSPVLSQIGAHFPEVSQSKLQMLVTMPGLLALVFAILSGWLVTRISKKKLLLFAALLSVVTGFLPLLADNFALLLGCRLVYGITLGLATALNTAVVADFFEGEERVKAMGVQAASVGGGMALIMYLSGWLGAADYRNSYLVYLIGAVAFLVIALCLPERGASGTQAGKVQLNRTVVIYAVFALLEYLFLITFTSQIALHLSGAYAGDSKTAGLLTSVFSLIQIVAGFVLGMVTRRAGKYTMALAMGSLAVGCLLVALFPGSLAPLLLGALLCGFSQGTFIPTGMVAVANAVDLYSAAMASAVFSCGLSLGQTLSPLVLNPLAGVFFGESSTTNIYLLAALGAALSAAAVALWKGRTKNV